MAARATRSATRRRGTRCHLIELSHNELGVIVDGLAVALSSTCLALQTLLELSEAPAEPLTTPPTSKLFEQAKALMKVGHARRLADMTAQLAAAVRARKQ